MKIPRWILEALAGVTLITILAVVFAWRGWVEGLDAGRAVVIGQLQGAVSGESNQWVQTKFYEKWDQGESGKVFPTKEYTNRFFTNWTLTVRQ